MVKIICGEEKYMIELEVGKILKDYADDSVKRYDFDEVDLEDIIYSLNSYNLFDSKSLILVRGFSVEKDIEQLIKYIEKKEYVNDLVLYTYKPLDKRKKITKILQSICDFTEFNKYDDKDLRGFAQNNLRKKNLEIDDEALNELISRVSGDLSYLVNQLNKIIYYKDEFSTVILEDIELLVSMDLSKKIFLLTDYVLQKNKKKALQLYFNLKNYTDEFALIGLVTKNLRNIMLVKEFKKFDLGQNEMAQLIGISPGQVYYINKQTVYEVRSTLTKIDNLEFEIKSGRSIKTTAFELFLLSI